MIFDPLVRTQTLDALVPNARYLWKGDEWEGLKFVGDTVLDYETFLKEYAAQVSVLDVKVKKNYFEGAIQTWLDDKALELGYESIHTAVTYADEGAVAVFQIEGRSLRAWRSKVWAASYKILDDVLKGVREEPSTSELLKELPAFVLLDG